MSAHDGARHTCSIPVVMDGWRLAGSDLNKGLPERSLIALKGRLNGLAAHFHAVLFGSNALRTAPKLSLRTLRPSWLRWVHAPGDSRWRIHFRLGLLSNALLVPRGGAEFAEGGKGEAHGYLHRISLGRLL